MPRIDVTAECIRRGLPRSATEDPIALAVRAIGFTGAAVTPADPESPHKAEGCRIGGRLDLVLARWAGQRPID